MGFLNDRKLEIYARDEITFVTLIYFVLVVISCYFREIVELNQLILIEKLKTGDGSDFCIWNLCLRIVDYFKQS